MGKGVITPNSGFPASSLYALLQSLRTTLLGFPNLRVGTTTTRVQVAAFAYRIGNRLYTKAAEDNVQVTGLTNTTATQTRKVRVQINAAGTLSFAEGGPATVQALAEIPRKTADLATVGWIEIPASFTYGTTAFSGSGVTLLSGDPDLGTGSGVPANDHGIAATILA